MTQRARWVWGVHGAIVVIAVTSYVTLTWESLSRSPSPSADGRFPTLELLNGSAQGLESIGAMLGLLTVLLYALVTSVLMIWASRSVWSLPLVHGTALALVAIGHWFEVAERDREEAEYRASPEFQERERARLLEDCWAVEARLGTRQDSPAEVTITNRGCPFPITVAGAQLIGSADDGPLRFLNRTPIEPVTVAPGSSTTVEVAHWGGSRHNLRQAQWTWECEVWLDQPLEDSYCFTTTGPTPGAPPCRVFALHTDP